MLALCEQYQPSINRDPSYKEYLDKILQIFFGVEPKRRSVGLFGNLIQSFLSGLDDDSDDELSSQASTSQVMQSELD